MGATERRIAAGFTRLGCRASLHVRALGSDGEIALHADDLAVMASVFKPIVALEVYAQALAGEIDASESVTIAPEAATPGPVGVSTFHDTVSMSLRDLTRLMLTISDNAATDVLTRRVGLGRVNARAALCGGCSTVVVSDLKTMLDGVGVEMGFADYAQLVAAQAGALGEDARVRGTDPDRLAALSALDPAQASRTTARDMTTFLAAVWSDAAAPPLACRRLREAMTQQVTRRIETAVPDGGGLAAKSGGLFGRVRNEIGVVTYPEGQAYAFAILTHAKKPFGATAAINRQMGRAVDLAIRGLRSG
jgi:beta-lactamase class A